MGYHVCGYNANTFGVTNFDMAPFTDSWLAIQNGHYLPQQQLKLFGGWFGGANLTAITLVTPTTRAVVPPRLYPIQGSLLPPDRPHIWDRRNNPTILNKVEEISVQANIGGAANAITTAILFVGDGINAVPPGPVYSLHGTATTAAVANVWTQVNVVWDQTIPAGQYVVIGSQHVSTNAIAHRFYFRTTPMKPGFLSLTSLTNITDPTYYFGGWGALGQFDTTVYPFIEVLCNGTDASHDLVMNMVKVA